MDNGSTINAVTPEFVKASSLDVSLLSGLVSGMVGINGFGGLFCQPLGHIIIRVQVEGVQGYDENQVALVIPDSTNFGSLMLVTLGITSINWTINMIKESKIDELLASLNGLRISHLLACHPAELSIRSEMVTNETVDLIEAVKKIKKAEIEAFSSKIIHAQTKTILLGNDIQVMKQTLEGGDGPFPPHSLSVVNTYTEMTTRSKQVVVVVKNLTDAPITITKDVKVTQVAAAYVETHSKVQTSYA